jgi:cellulose synthase/poly-beta-1,6-N-acetylglucosamine synthase-like glycosyltransferase
MLVLGGVICLAFLAILLCWQMLCGWHFVRQSRGTDVSRAERCSERETASHGVELPHVAVLLPLRGADPSLAACLRGLLNQDYPRYDLRIIIDSREDPAWNLVHEILGPDGDPRVTVSLLQSPRPTCGLKSSALLQAIGTLDRSCQAVVLIDADVIPYRSWLHDLVLPLTDPQVGATTGIRWFTPNTATWGSLVRYLWNAAASVQMHALHIPWGGSLALRADVFRRSNLLQQWAVSLWEDTGSYRVLRELGLRLHFVPAATMVNRETTNLKDCFRFIRRQMLNVRLYHGSWPAILAHGIGSAMALSVALTLTALSFVSGSWQAMLLPLTGIALYAGGMGLTLISVEQQVHRVARGRGERMASISWKTLCAIPLAHLVYFACLASASILGRISWRGITYEFEGPWTVRMRKYRPYRMKKAAKQAVSVT